MRKALQPREAELALSGRHCLLLITSTRNTYLSLQRGAIGFEVAEALGLRSDERNFRFLPCPPFDVSSPQGSRPSGSGECGSPSAPGLHQPSAGVSLSAQRHWENLGAFNSLPWTSISDPWISILPVLCSRMGLFRALPDHPVGMSPDRSLVSSALLMAW